MKLRVTSRAEGDLVDIQTKLREKTPSRLIASETLS